MAHFDISIRSKLEDTKLSIKVQFIWPRALDTKMPSVSFRASVKLGVGGHISVGSADEKNDNFRSVFVTNLIFISFVYLIDRICLSNRWKKILEINWQPICSTD